jgi:hypothetical protein
VDVLKRALEIEAGNKDISNLLREVQKKRITLSPIPQGHHQVAPRSAERK